MDNHNFPFTITRDDKHHLEPSLPAGLYDAYEQVERLVERQSDKAVRKLRQLIADHPRTPHFKLALANYYDDAGNPDAALALCREVLAQFPTCLEVRVDLVRNALMLDDVVTAQSLLGPALELPALHPKQTAFHETDVANYYGAVAAYLAATGRGAESKQLMEQLEAAFPTLLEVKHADLFINEMALHKARLGMAALRASLVKVTGKPLPVDTATEEPRFVHEQVARLYGEDFSIAGELLEELLALPTDSLVADLHLLIADSWQRYNQFVEDTELLDLPAEFLTHAIMLLAEKEHAASLPRIFEAMRNGEEFHDFYFGDLSLEGLWHAFYRLGRPDVAPLFHFLKEFGITADGKLPVLQALEQLYIQEPNLQEAIRAGVEELARHYMAHGTNPELADTYVAVEICELLRICKVPGADLLIRQLFATGIMSANIFGTIDAYLDSEPRSQVRPVMRIHELYHHIEETWTYGDAEDTSLLDDDMDDAAGPLALPAAKPKVGRNEPCPCGSGKKYKKCCGKDE